MGLEGVGEGREWRLVSLCNKRRPAPALSNSRQVLTLRTGALKVSEERRQLFSNQPDALSASGCLAGFRLWLGCCCGWVCGRAGLQWCTNRPTDRLIRDTPDKGITERAPLLPTGGAGAGAGPSASSLFGGGGVRQRRVGEGAAGGRGSPLVSGVGWRAGG